MDEWHDIRQTKTIDDIKQLVDENGGLSAVRKSFMNSFHAFQEQQHMEEQKRHNYVDTVNRIERMSWFLVNRSEKEQPNFQMNNNDEGKDIDLLYMEPGIKRFQDIQMWSKVTEGLRDPAENIPKVETDIILKHHREKLENLRKNKEWDILCAENDIDHEGEALLKAIENYKTEVGYSTGFYD